jgi:hypothetical protein
VNQPPPPDSNLEPLVPESGIQQKVENSLILGGVQAARGDNNFQIQGDNNKVTISPDKPPHTDWTKLLEQTRENLTAVPDKIGNTVFLPRLIEMEAIATAFERSKAVAILGTSGCGKTVIAKSWVEKELNSRQVIWWNGGKFDVPDFSCFQSCLGLSNALRDVLAVATPFAYLVIDGLDRIFSEAAFQNLSVLIHTLQLDVEASPWRLLIPCQLEEWDRVRRQLSRVNIITTGWEIIPIKEPSIDDLEPVWKAFPALGRLKYQLHLQSLLLKPKVLDLLATKLLTGEAVDTTQWVGESNLAEWFWETEVCKQPNARMRASFLKSLGEKQADNLEAKTPTDSFSTSDLIPVDSLISDRICQEREEHLFFYHDLYGDWSRQRVLLGKKNSLCEYLESRISSPLWHRAVRLYGLYLLEKNTDITLWRSTFNVLKNASALTQDLLLEAVIFAANPLPLLDRLWPDLIENRGLLLRRLLGRFLQVATQPNPIVREILGANSETLAATINRLPYWPYWLPMLRFLHRNLENVIVLAPKQVAEIADAWLRSGGDNAPLRIETAELALALAEQILQREQLHYGDELCEIIYRAALAGAPDLPERLGALALEASARLETNSPALQDSEGGGVSQWGTVYSSFGQYEVEMPPPWPDGPRWEVDSEFQKACLEPGVLYPLILSNPSLAREVLLALLIKEPIPPDPSESAWYLGDDLLETARVEVWEYKPPFYNRGPFLYFLENQPTEGLEVILRLVNFATERWAARFIEQGHPVPEVNATLQNCKYQWIGDAVVYSWYRPHYRCPKPIAIVLMALEKWLYDRIDKEESIDSTINLILQRSNSLAFAGLLSAVGCKKPTLFQGVLRPLLLFNEFHEWESFNQYNLEGLYIGDWSREPQWSIDLARDWYALPHRVNGIHNCADHLFLNEPSMRDFFEEIRTTWIVKLNQESQESKRYLEKLIVDYDIENYTEMNDSEQGNALVFTPPSSVLARNVKLSQEIVERSNLTFFPFKCLQILDKGQVLSSNHLEQFWNVLQQISNVTLPESSDEVISRNEDALCGGAAVLLKLHRDWLKQNPEKEEWCFQEIIKTIFNPPIPVYYDAANSINSLGWEAFCAQLIPMIWSENPSEPIIRACIARLALNNHYETVKILFNSAAYYRNSLGDNFKQLQHLIRRCSVLRWRRDQSRSQRESNIDIETKLQQEFDSFVQNTISPIIPSLGEISFAMVPGKSSKAHLYYRQIQGIDLTLIQSAYTWLPSLDQTTSETERNELITFWKEALSCTFQIMGDEDEEIAASHQPHEWNQWVTKQIAILVLQLRTTDEPEKFWQPILCLGKRGEFCIKFFLDAWFINGMRVEPASEKFIKRWKEMVEFVLSSPQWNRKSLYLEDAWYSLLGFRHFNFWTEAQKPVVRQMYPLYQRWAKEHLKNPYYAERFIIFLGKPAAEEILFDGLTLLEEVLILVNESFWKSDLQSCLVSLLDYCWRCHQSKLRHNPKAFDAFKELLKKLANFQNPMAIEIQQRLQYGQ